WRLDNPSVGSIQWTDLNGNLQITQFTGIALHPTNPNIALGGSQDNGTVKYNGSLAWSTVLGGDGGYVRIDPTNPQHVYTEFNFSRASFFYRSDDGGNTFHDKTSGIQGNGIFYTPYALDSQNSNRLVLGTDFINQS